MMTPQQPEDLPVLPEALSDRLLAVLFGDPQRRAVAFGKLLAANPLHAAALQAHLRHHLQLEQGQAAGDTPSIPGYRLLETLGEGGMGTVYLAEQAVPKRRVAIKLIKLGMDSKAVVARFEQERQALALMQHDGIAKVFDCGTSERGQPFFVMELVKGIPLTNYCDQQRLSLPDRLKLMQQVCAAVTHAHQKGVVHRDLKPGNVLVSEEQGKVHVKIIDFGLAKAMGQKLVEATLFTEAGQVVGTPEYMAPEQADVTNADIDTRADVYSLGVMLYEVLTGQLPFSGAELRQAGLLEMQRVLREVEPPKPSTRLTSVQGSAAAIAAQRRTSAAALHKALRTDLDWLVLKALEKDRARRYDTANALAMDLQRYLDHEPLVAGPPSAGYRLRKLVRKYRGQVLAASAVVATAVVGAIVAVNFAIASNENAILAKTNEGTAKANAALAQTNEQRANDKAAEALREKERADAKVREFNQLKGVVLYDRAVANEKELYPAWPHKVGAMERWLKEDAGMLLAMQPEIERTVRDLESRALPPTPDEIEADRRSHPKFAAFEVLGKRVASLRHAQAIREGKAQIVVPELTAEQQALDAKALKKLAWDRVAPKVQDRTVWGEEALGLAAARRAAEKAKGTPAECQILDTLAWALVANGQDEAAKQASEAAWDKATEEQSVIIEERRRSLDMVIAGTGEELAAAEREFAELTAVVNERRTFQFELESHRFLHDTLAGLLGKLASLQAKEKAAVEQRLLWAKQVQGLSLAHPNARHKWAAVRAAIARNEKYSGQNIELRDQDVTGLVPIGENPVTKLWEFYELRSAWDGNQEPGAIAIPAHGPDGFIEVKGETGIVFVLLPGGTFVMGAQKEDKDGPNFDPQAVDDETPDEVTLLPFFLARHELTQGQWARLWTGDESLRWPSFYKVGKNYRGIPVTVGLSHPVETVSWEMCDTLLRRNGMLLPTEAQWEFGCRAGRTTPWYTGDLPASLAGHGNVLDRDAVKDYPVWGIADAFEDGFAGPAPVGHYRGSNAFGLHDVHGNVWEWCQDWYGSHAAPSREGDGLRLVGSPSGYRCNRGGSFQGQAARARSAIRGWDPPSIRGFPLGLRPLRTLRLRD